MKRKKKNTVSRVYSYGLLAPIENEEIVNDQLYKANRYKNKFVELERKKREDREEIRMESSAYVKAKKAYTDAAHKKEGIEKEIKALRSKERTRKINKALKEKLSAVQKEVEKLSKELSTVRKKVDKDKEDKIEKVYEDINNEQKQVREELGPHGDGLYWGTYLLVEKSMELAYADPHPPKFRRFAGKGRLGVHINRGMPTEDIFKQNTLITIDPVDPKAWHGEIRAERKRLSRTKLHMRIASNKRKPVWATWPMIMHRPLPAGWLVKDAYVIRKKIGTRTKDELRIVVESPEGWKPPKRHGKGVVGVDIGWRKRPNGGLRVAYWYDDSGDSGELVLDNRLVNGDKKKDDLQETRDKNRNRVLKQVVPMLKKLDRPEWFVEETKYLSQWQSQKRLAKFVRKWKNNRFHGDEAAYTLLEAWRYNDQHLWDWKRSIEEYTKNRRRERYRLFAVALAEKYEKVIMEDIKLDKLAKRKPLGRDEDDARYAARAKSVASVGDLRDIIADACFMRRTEFLKAPPEYTTMQCHKCGSVEHWDQAKELEHKCSNCGEEWDQDYNAAVNLCFASD